MQNKGCLSHHGAPAPLALLSSQHTLGPLCALAELSPLSKAPLSVDPPAPWAVLASVPISLCCQGLLHPNPERMGPGGQRPVCLWRGHCALWVATSGTHEAGPHGPHWAQGGHCWPACDSSRLIQGARVPLELRPDQPDPAGRWAWSADLGQYTLGTRRGHPAGHCLRGSRSNTHALLLWDEQLGCHRRPIGKRSLCPSGSAHHGQPCPRKPERTYTPSPGHTDDHRAPCNATQRLRGPLPLRKEAVHPGGPTGTAAKTHRKPLGLHSLPTTPGEERAAGTQQTAVSTQLQADHRPTTLPGTATLLHLGLGTATQAVLEVQDRKVMQTRQPYPQAETQQEHSPALTEHVHKNAHSSPAYHRPAQDDDASTQRGSTPRAHQEHTTLPRQNQARCPQQAQVSHTSFKQRRTRGSALNDSPTKHPNTRKQPSGQRSASKVTLGEGE